MCPSTVRTRGEGRNRCSASGAVKGHTFGDIGGLPRQESKGATEKTPRAVPDATHILSSHLRHSKSMSISHRRLHHPTTL